MMAEKKFIFEKITSFSLFKLICTVLIIVFVLLLLYFNYYVDKYGTVGVLVILLLTAFFCAAFVKIFTSKLEITINNNNLVITYSGKALVLNKDEVLGFYAYDYTNIRYKSLALIFVLKNGKKIHFTDIGLHGSNYDPEQTNNLHIFVNKLAKTFGFSRIKKVRWRTMWLIASVWYSK